MPQHPLNISYSGAAFHRYCERERGVNPYKSDLERGLLPPHQPLPPRFDQRRGLLGGASVGVPGRRCRIPVVEEHRDQLLMSEHMVTMDPPQHTRARSLLNRLLTPKRLKENEDFMWPLADKFLDDFLPKGKCEFLEEYAKPFSPSKT